VGIFHYWRKHRDAVAEIELRAREAEEAKLTAADLEQLVVASHAIANAVDAESLRVETWRQIPAVLKNRRCWLAVRGPGGWQWIIEPADDTEVSLELASSLLHLAESGTHRHDEWLTVPLYSSGRALGILLIDVTTPMGDAERSRVETLATVVGIALKNVQLFAEMQTASASDALTGCFNRGYAFQMLDRELRRSKRNGSPLTAVMLDVDGFKQVNDEHGHLTGDRLLAAIGNTLESSLRVTDYKCRYGGDEFLIVLPETPYDAAVHVADHLRRSLESLEIPLRSDGSLTCRVSLGVAAAEAGELDAMALVQRADEALYRDKLDRLAAREMALPALAATTLG
jgi:diguanylate cyclase (GGDEF)-like protein